MNCHTSMNTSVLKKSMFPPTEILKCEELLNFTKADSWDREFSSKLTLAMENEPYTSVAVQ